MAETYILYNLILLSTAFFAHISNLAKNGKAIFICIVFFILWLPSATRINTGADFPTYVDMYRNPDFWHGQIEFGFYYLIEFLRYLGLDEQSLFIVTSGIVAFFFVKAIKTSDIFLSSIIYVATIYISSYCVIRQMMAVTILMYSCRLWIENKKTKSSIILLLAFSFHYSMILFAPLVIAAEFLAVKRTKAIILMACTLIFVFALNGVDLILNSSIFAQSKYSYYLNSSFIKGGAVGSGLGVLVKVSIPLMCVYLSNRILAENKRNNILIYSAIAYAMTTLLATQVYIFIRLADVFSFAPVMCAPLVYRCSKTTIGKLSVIGVVLIYILMLNHSIATNTLSENKRIGSGPGISPYTSVFE